MTPQASNPGISRIGATFFVLCFLGIAYANFLVFSPFFRTLVWAGVLTVVFSPLFGRILLFTRGRRTVAAFITCILILLLIVLPVTLLATLVTSQSVSLYHSVQTGLGSMGSDSAARWQKLQSHPTMQWIQAQATRWLGLEVAGLESYARQALSTISRWVVSQGPSFLAGVGGLLFGFLLVFITMFFLFRDGPQILKFVGSANPLPAAYQSEIIQKFKDVSYATFYGSILTAIVQGAAAALLFWALGVPSPLFWGAIVSLVSLVPIVGAFLVWLPMAGYFLLLGDSTRTIILLAVGGIVVSSIDNLLKPMIIRGRTDMHPLLVFLSVLGGMQVFGFLGILLGPLAVAVFLSFVSFYQLEFGQAAHPKATDAAAGD